jgi:hypothetical protein
MGLKDGIAKNARETPQFGDARNISGWSDLTNLFNSIAESCNGSLNLGTVCNSSQLCSKGEMILSH